MHAHCIRDITSWHLYSLVVEPTLHAPKLMCVCSPALLDACTVVHTEHRHLDHLACQQMVLDCGGHLLKPWYDDSSTQITALPQKEVSGSALTSAAKPELPVLAWTEALPIEDAVRKHTLSRTFMLCCACRSDCVAAL